MLFLVILLDVCVYGVGLIVGYGMRYFYGFIFLGLLCIRMWIGLFGVCEIDIRVWMVWRG